MISKTEIQMDKLMRTLNRVRPVLNKSMKAIVKQSARQVIESAVKYTPPSGKGAQGKSAQRRGEAAIATDLFGGRRGSGMGGDKHRRRMGIFFAVKEAILRKFQDGNGNNVKIKARVAADKEVLFIRKDGSVYATQKNMYKPEASMGEMMAHHRRYFKNGRMTSSVSGMATTGQWVFVDSFVTTKKKLDEFSKILFKRVGIWSAGWMPAITKLKARRIPAWIKRHKEVGGKNGRCTITPETGDADKFMIEMANSTGYGSLQRVIEPALKGSRRKMIEDYRNKKRLMMVEAGFNK